MENEENKREKITRQKALETKNGRHGSNIRTGRKILGIFKKVSQFGRIKIFKKEGS